MRLSRFLLPAPLLASPAAGSPVVGPASAASFDCGAAGTSFEHAISAVPDPSAADDRLAKSPVTAAGGLTEPAGGLTRTNQRDWRDFAQRACTDDAEPLRFGS